MLFRVKRREKEVFLASFANMEPCLNEPLNLCTKNSPRLSDVDASEASPVHRTIIDYDEACLATTRENDVKENCDKNSTTATTTTNGTSTPPSGLDGDAIYDSFLRPNDGETTTSVNGTFDWQNKEKNPNLLLQQQYFLLHQHQQHQQHLMNNAPDGSVAKMHLDKYMKLTNRYLDTMSPFFQHFTPLMNQSPAGQPSTSVQAAATAAATLLTSNLNQQHNQSEESETSPETPESSDGSSNSLLSQDSVRYFLHKLIEHNFLQQLQQQQQINDLINNNNHQNNNNNNNNNNTNNSGKGTTSYACSKDKSPSSNEGDTVDFYNHHMMSQQNNQHTKTFLDFLKNAAAAQSVNAMNQANSRNQQSYKRWEGDYYLLHGEAGDCAITSVISNEILMKNIF